MIRLDGISKKGRPKLTLKAVVRKDIRLLDLMEHNALDRAQ